MSETHVRKLETIENKLANLKLAPDIPIQTSDKYRDTNPFNNKQPYKQYEQQRGKNAQTQSSNPFRQNQNFQYQREFRMGDGNNRRRINENFGNDYDKMGSFCYMCGSRDGHLARTCNNRDNKFCPPCKSRDHCFLECPLRARCTVCNKAGHESMYCF